MNRFLKRFASTEDGATMVEYALMVALVGAALVTVVTLLSGSVGTQFSSMSGTIGGQGSKVGLIQSSDPSN